MENDKIINGNCWVAYFDMLGFRNRVETLSWQSVLNTYNDILKEIERNSWAVSCKWFSDTFVFYTSDDSRNSFCGIEGSLRVFFRHMFVTRKIPFTGCLTFGEVYIDPAKNIFFGPGLLKAHDVAEDEDWIGYVLTCRAVDKAKKYSGNGGSAWDVFKRYYTECDVPFKSGGKRKLWVYNFQIDANGNTPQATKLQIQLWDALLSMESVAKRYINEKIKREKITGIEKCRAYKRVLRKYKNTKNFLLQVLPRLKKEIKGHNKQISYVS